MTMVGGHQQDDPGLEHFHPVHFLGSLTLFSISCSTLNRGRRGGGRGWQHVYDHSQRIEDPVESNPPGEPLMNLWCRAKTHCLCRHPPVVAFQLFSRTFSVVLRCAGATCPPVASSWSSWWFSPSFSNTRSSLPSTTVWLTGPSSKPIRVRGMSRATPPSWRMAATPRRPRLIRRTYEVFQETVEDFPCDPPVVVKLFSPFHV